MSPTLKALIARLSALNDDALFSEEVALSSQIKQLRATIQELVDLADQASGEHSAAELLVIAYAKGDESNSVEWEDLNLAVEQAREELGQERCDELSELVQMS